MGTPLRSGSQIVQPLPWLGGLEVRITNEDQGVDKRLPENPTMNHRRRRLPGCSARTSQPARCSQPSERKTSRSNLRGEYLCETRRAREP